MFCFVVCKLPIQVKLENDIVEKAIQGATAPCLRTTDIQRKGNHVLYMKVTRDVYAFHGLNNGLK